MPGNKGFCLPKKVFTLVHGLFRELPDMSKRVTPGEKVYRVNKKRGFGV